MMSLVSPLALGVLNSKCKNVQVDSTVEQIPSSAEQEPSANGHFSKLDVEQSDLGIEVLLGAKQTEVKEGDKEDSSRDGCEAKKISQDPLSHLPPSLDRNYLDFPFFTDPKTIRHISKGKTKIMFIMRGLSGSGKSSIVRMLTSTYKDTVVCSADEYFLNEDGDYIFDVEKLGGAHSYCQNKAKSSCQNAISVVIIDNTNVKRWEMKFYLDTAKLFGYAVVLVEPKTEWKFKPEELALRNKHGVPVEVLRKKVDAFSTVTPLYYGWFLSHKKSDLLRSLSSKVFAHCLDSFPAFRSELLSELGVHRSGRVSPDTAKEILLGYYPDQGKTSPLLHCTSRFCGGGKASGGKRYDSRKDVQSSCGRVFRLTLTGLVMTKKTYGIRVTLDDKCMPLFERPEEQEWVPRSSNENDSRKGSTGISSSSASLKSDDGQWKVAGKNGEKKGPTSSKKLKKRLAKEKKKMELEKWFNSKDDCDGVEESEGVKSKSSLCELMSARISEKNGNEEADNECDGDNNDDNNSDDSRIEGDHLNSTNPSANLNSLFPQLRNNGFARSAHITLLTANNASSVETNSDILHACDVENSRNNNFDPADLISVPKGKAVHFVGDGMCCVYLDEPVKMDAIFSGYY